MTPTEEQQCAIDLFLTGKNVVINAGAGTGKTATLRMIAEAAGTRRGLYLAFNKAIAQEAQRRFRGTNVVAMSQHSLAFASHGRPFQHRLGKRADDLVKWHDKAKHIGVTKYAFEPGSGANAAYLGTQKIMGMVTQAVKAFMTSADRDFMRDHVEIPDNLATLRDAHVAKLQDAIIRYAQKYWADLTDPEGIIRYEHSAYFKAWSLDDPKLNYDFILYDEAQDADPIMIDVLAKQTHAQIITVGDRHQQIYGWRGSVASMDAFNGEHAQLSQSFRFGEAVADYANRWLGLLGSTMKLRGRPDIPSKVAAPKVVKNRPDAVLCRTNAHAISEIVDAQAAGCSVGIAGDRKAFELRDLAQAALKLQQEGWTTHPDLRHFNTWSDVVVHAKSDDGEDIRPLVEIVERVGAAVVVNAINSCVPTDQAELVVSTAHVAKGLEWRYVKIASDFREPKRKAGVIQPIPAEEARLIYVAVTRAILLLDITGLSWLDDYLAEGGWVEGGPVPADDEEDDPAATVHMEREGQNSPQSKEEMYV